MALTSSNNTIAGDLPVMKIVPNLANDLVIVDRDQHNESAVLVKYERADTKGIRDIKTLDELDRFVYEICMKFRDFLSNYLNANQISKEKLYFYTGLVYEPGTLDKKLFPQYLNYLRSFVRSALKPMATTSVDDQALLLDGILEFDLELALLGLSYDRVKRANTKEQ